MQTMANDGLLGTGVGYGQLLKGMPAVSSGYSFAAVVEELVTLGGAVVCLAFATVTLTAARAARTMSRNSFQRGLLSLSSGLILAQALIALSGVYLSP